MGGYVDDQDCQILPQIHNKTTNTIHPYNNLTPTIRHPIPVLLPVLDLQNKKHPLTHNLNPIPPHILDLPTPKQKTRILPSTPQSLITPTLENNKLKPNKNMYNTIEYQI